MKETIDALRKIRMAMLLLVFDVNIMGFDFLPDFAAWFLMLSAASLLEGQVRGVGRLRGFGRLLAAYDIIACVFRVGAAFGRFGREPQLFLYAGWLVLCIRIYFMYTMLTAAADAAMQAGGEAGTAEKLCLGRNAVLLAEVAIYITLSCFRTWDWLSGVFGAVMAVLGVLYFIFYFYCVFVLTYLKEEIQRKDSTEGQAGE